MYCVCSWASREQQQNWVAEWEHPSWEKTKLHLSFCVKEQESLSVYFVLLASFFVLIQYHLFLREAEKYRAPIHWYMPTHPQKPMVVLWELWTWSRFCTRVAGAQLFEQLLWLLKFSIRRKTDQEPGTSIELRRLNLCSSLLGHRLTPWFTVSNESWV